MRLKGQRTGLHEAQISLIIKPQTETSSQSCLRSAQTVGGKQTLWVCKAVYGLAQRMDSGLRQKSRVKQSRSAREVDECGKVK